MASHNRLAALAHKYDVDQAEITAFLRTLLTSERTQVTWARDAGIPYNTLTNWFTEKPAKMTAVNFLRLVIAANAAEELRDWLQGAARGGLAGLSAKERRQAEQELRDTLAGDARAKKPKRRA